MREWKGLMVPCEPKKEWGKWMCGGTCTVCNVLSCVGEGVCKSVISCLTCIYSSCNGAARKEFYNECFPEKPKKLPKRDSNGRFCKKAATLPKLTVEVFNRSDCPEWADWAAVDESGLAWWYKSRPTYGGACQWYPIVAGVLNKMISGTRFDPFDWQHSLIERPTKKLPKLTQTAFHSPDCPKEATTLKVFPANHVVALDKDNKVLQVMELQCGEGEVRKPVSDWYYSPAADDLYRADESDRRIPEDAYPVEVYHHSPGYLVGLAVTHRLTERIYLISDVRGNLVTLKGIDREDVLSMVSLILNYRFTGTNGFCCEFERL